MNGDVDALVEIAATKVAQEQAIASAIPATERALLTLLAGGPLDLAANDLRVAAALTNTDTVDSQARHLLLMGLARLSRPTIRRRHRERRGAA